MESSMPDEQTDPRVDAYIEKAAPFAQPVLTHLRTLMHQACPRATESVKWGMPFFVQNGVILTNMAAFKQHCAFGFWGPEMKRVLARDGLEASEAMGTLGRITTIKDLPSNKQMLDLLRQAKDFIDSGNYTSPIAARNKVVKAPKPAPEIPIEFTQALKANKAANKVFANFSPSCQREYTEWITEAKRPETRDKRIAQAVEWIAEGKQRNWKYQNC